MKISGKYIFILLCVGIVIGVLIFYSKFNKPTKVGTIFDPPFLQFSPDFNHLAFSAVEKISRDDDWTYGRTNVYVLDITTKKLQKVINNSKMGVSWLTWQPGSNKQKLWISIIKSCWVCWPRWTLFQIDMDESQKWQITRSYVDTEIVKALYWNPAGTVLAGRPKRDFLVPKHIVHGNIAVSWNEGRDAIYYEGVQCYSRFLWIDENTFLAQDTGEKTINEFFVGDHTLSLVKTFQYGKEGYLFGIYNDKPVYRLKGGIYVGEELIYDSEKTLPWIRVEKPYVYFCEDLNIVIFDVESKEMFRIDTTKKDIRPVGLVPCTSKVYWLSERKEIFSWNFKDSSAIESVLKIESIKNK